METPKAGTSFEQAYLTSKNLTGVFSLDGAVLDDKIEGYTFHDCTLTNGSFAGSNFENCIFKNVLFNGIGLEATVFRNCFFEDITFKKCPIDMIRMEHCTGTPPQILPS